MVGSIWQKVTDPKRVFVIAEAGVNHNGSLEMAKRMVDVAVNVGADAIKFQTFKAEKVVSNNAPKADYQIKTTDIKESQLEMLRRLELSYDSFEILKSYCNDRDITFLSTPFDIASADFLDEIEIELFKIPSGEITNFPFLSHIAKKKKPMIISTGMAYLGEVEAALNVIEATGNTNIALLHCVSNYPTSPQDVNLRAIDTLKKAFALPVGFSDHTLGFEIAISAVALNTCIIEKHFTLDRKLSGPDHSASLDPDELKTMINGIRKVEMALGHGLKKPAQSEMNTRIVARRSLVASQDIPENTVLTEDMIDIKRPGSGLSPIMLQYIIGRVSKKKINQGSLIDFGILC